jgi:signal transduction histidine kinase
LGGAVQLTSPVLDGQGTRFSFTVPLAEAQNAESESAQSRNKLKPI